MKKTSSKKIIKQPKPSSVSGRSSTLNAEFIKSKIPYLPVSEEDLKTRYSLFFAGNLAINAPKCFYCEGRQTEWDHLISPLRKKKELQPGEEQMSGYFHEVNNLIPACNSCNSSKGNTEYAKWMLSTSLGAKHNLTEKYVKTGLNESQAISKIESKIDIINSVLKSHPPKHIMFSKLIKANKDIEAKEKELKEKQEEINKIMKGATGIAKELSELYLKALKK